MLLWQVIFYHQLLISHFLCCARSFLLMTLRVSLLCLIYASVFLSCQTLCWLLYLPPSLRFLSTHTFCLIFVPFHVSSPSIFLFLFFCPVFYTLSVSFLTSHLSSLLYLPLDIFFSTLFLWSLSSFILSPDLYLHIYVCIHMSLLHSRSSILQLKQNNDFLC